MSIIPGWGGKTLHLRHGLKHRRKKSWGRCRYQTHLRWCLPQVYFVLSLQPKFHLEGPVLSIGKRTSNHVIVCHVNPLCHVLSRVPQKQCFGDVRRISVLMTLCENNWSSCRLCCFFLPWTCHPDQVIPIPPPKQHHGPQTFSPLSLLTTLPTWWAWYWLP